MKASRFLASLVALATVAPLTSAAAQLRAVDVHKPVVVVSSIGGKCLNAEGAHYTNGTRIIGYPCSGSSNEQFTFNSNGTISINGKCLNVSGGLGRDGDQIILWNCDGGANEKWRWDNGRLVGQNNKCLDLKGGSWGNLPFMNQPVILYSCNGQDNQTWRWGVVVPRRAVPHANVIASGAIGRVNPIEGMAGVIAAGGGNVIAAGGGNVIAAGGGNVIAAGGGN